jgi:regulation of enolase protein 1 (concanavalin A-like superfamily)
MNLPNPFPAGIKTSVTVQVQTQTTPTYKFKKAGTAGNLIAVILDESGSMSSCYAATIAGFNEYVAGQKAATEAGAAFMTLNKFDAPQIKTVFADRPIAEVPLLDKTNYRPNGGTNLLDAIGHTIEQINTALSNKKKKDRPGVIVVITTDGHENASNQYDNAKIKAMVAAAEKSDWSFVFMGANIDSFSVGSSFGMNAMNTVNYSTTNMTGTMASLSATTTRMRSAKMAGLDTQAVYSTTMFTDAEKQNMK